MGGNGEIPLLHDTAGGVGDFVQQHLVVLLPVYVQIVALHGEQDGLLEPLAVDVLVLDGQLGGGPGVQGIQQIRIAEEHGGFVLLAGNGIVDVREANGLGELGALLKDAVRPEALDGQGVLHGAGDFKLLLILLHGALQ